MLWTRRGLGEVVWEVPHPAALPPQPSSCCPCCWLRGNPQNLGHTLFVIEIWPAYIDHFDLSALLCLRINFWLLCSTAGTGCEADAGLFWGRDWVVIFVLTEVDEFPLQACILITNRNGKQPQFLLSFSSHFFSPPFSVVSSSHSCLFKNLLYPFPNPSPPFCF